MRRWAWLCVLASVACGDAPAPTTPLMLAPPSSEGHGATVMLAYADVRITEATVLPAAWVPGDPATLELSIEAAGDGPWPATIDVSAPRPGSRQVALGGPDAPPVHVPSDPRTQRIDVQLTTGTQRIELPALPVPFHPRRALVTLRLDGRVATAGPRHADGTGVLALAPVATVPTAVVAPRVADPLVVDGVLDEWPDTAATELVTSLEGEPFDGLPTTVRWAWDDTALYVGAEIGDTDVWSTYTQQDEPLWKQEVFEVFVFADDDGQGYLEFQLSPRGVTFDARFAQYRRGDEAWDSTWQTAARLDGTLDARDDADRGWTAEIAIPWDEICAETSATCPPTAGQVLRVNAFRFERPAEGPPAALALSPTRVPDFHAAANAAMLTLAP